MRNIEGSITLAHGAGGRVTHQLIRDIFQHHLKNAWIDQGNDGALLPQAAFPTSSSDWVTSTDGYVVSPLIFPGGDIGSLAVHGTLNDIAMMGAKPLWLTASFILEEGLPLALLDEIVASMARASRHAGVPVVAGDTKVVERGKGDGLFISTAGFGSRLLGADCRGDNARDGDSVILSGTLGDHAIALMAERHGLTFETPLFSDTASLHELVKLLITEEASAIHVLRDPTRGGLGTSLNEIAVQSGVAIELDESCLPIRPEVASTSELLGLDPLYLANEGKMIVICDTSRVDQVLSLMQSHALGLESRLIGNVRASNRPYVEMKTLIGGQRLVDWLSGELLPRIC